jgi:predicted transcriptional regulator
MDIVYERGEVSVADVLKRVPDPPSYSAVRAAIRLLEEKGHLKHREDGPRYLFSAIVPRDQAARSATKRLLDTFFDGQPDKAMAALLEASDLEVSDDVLKRMKRLMDKVKREGR